MTGVLTDERIKENEIRKKRCKAIIGQSQLAIRSSLAKEKDIQFIKMMLQAEQTGKRRKSILRIIKEKLLRETTILHDAWRQSWHEA